MIDVLTVESCFVRPNEWIPERFDTEPELVKDTRSFLPFAQGMLIRNSIVPVQDLIFSYRSLYLPGQGCGDDRDVDSHLAPGQ